MLERREQLPQQLTDCADAEERERLIQLDRRLALTASPRALADRPEGPDLSGIEEAIGPNALPEQRALLLDPVRPASVRRAAAAALARVGDPRGLEGLLEAASRADLAGRSAAAEALGRVAPAQGTRRALELLLLDPEEDVRAAAARSLAQDLAASATLARELGRERSPAVLIAILRALGRAGSSRELPLVLAFAGGEGPVADAARWTAHELQTPR